VAYRDDILALGANHHWDFDGDSLDQIGTVNGTDSGTIYTLAAIAEDATFCMATNGLADQVSMPTTTDINNSAQTRKIVCGWLRSTGLQEPPTNIYNEGNETTGFRIVLFMGNTLMFEVVEPTNFTLQLIADNVIEVGRNYHICAVFYGSGFANTAALFIDGVQQILAIPDPATPGTASLDARGVAEFGDTSGTVGLGGVVVNQRAGRNSRYNHWATFNNKTLTVTQIREELFEKGALPTSTISAGTEAAMQTALDAFANTAPSNEALDFRVETVTGDGDISLDSDNITHNALSSIHVQYMGTGTLTWRNTNGSNASIGSTPNGGTIVFVAPQTLTVNVKDASDSSLVQNARVYIEADSGGPLAAGTVILNTLTNASGIANIAFDYSADQPIIGRVRKGTSSTRYKTGTITGPLTSTALNISILLVRDE